MTHIVVGEPFDMDKLAEKFPGQLIFRGASSTEAGDTEILGDVDQEELVTALKDCLTVDTTTDPTVTDVSPILVSTPLLPPIPVPQPPDHPTFPTPTLPSIPLVVAVVVGLIVGIDLLVVLVLHLLGAM